MISRRWPLVIVLVALLIGAIAVGSASAPRVAPAATPTELATVDAHARSSVWFCPGPPTRAMLGADRITMANTATTDAVVVVTARPDRGKPSQRTFTVPASSVTTKARTDLGPLGALTVESFGAPIEVEENLEGSALVAGGPCAADAATRWYFAAGTTPRGAEQWVVLDDPYASDAKVDITLRTSNGVRRPDKLQGLDIARRSRVVVPIHSYAVREDRVSVEIDVRIGAVVATQMLVFDGSGAAWSLGSPIASDHWVVAEGDASSEATTWVAIANVANNDAQVDVHVLPGNRQVVAAAMLTIAEDDVVWVQIGECAAGAAPTDCVPLPAGLRYSVDVRTDEGTPIVVQMLSRGSSVVTAPLGAPQPRVSLIFPSRGVTGGQGTVLSFVDQQAAPARVDVSLVRRGRTIRPAALQGIIVRPGSRRTVRVAGGNQPPGSDTALVIVASVPVFVQRSMLGASDAAVSGGVAVS
jgi:hypothetical protein